MLYQSRVQVQIFWTIIRIVIQLVLLHHMSFFFFLLSILVCTWCRFTSLNSHTLSMDLIFSKFKLFTHSSIVPWEGFDFLCQLKPTITLMANEENFVIPPARWNLLSWKQDMHNQCKKPRCTMCYEARIE